MFYFGYPNYLHFSLLFFLVIYQENIYIFFYYKKLKKNQDFLRMILVFP